MIDANGYCSPFYMSAYFEVQMPPSAEMNMYNNDASFDLYSRVL